MSMLLMHAVLQEKKACIKGIHEEYHLLGYDVVLSVSTELLGLHLCLAWDLSSDDWDLIDHITIDKVSRLAEDGKAKHCRKFQRLHKTQHPRLPPDNRKTVINLSEVPLEESACSALSKGLNYVVALAVLPVEDILCGVEKAVGALPEETAEEVRQETVRILKGSHKPKDNLTGIG
jgi:hypothetical protein